MNMAVEVVMGGVEVERKVWHQCGKDVCMSKLG
jgi:hypothetical protein